MICSFFAENQGKQEKKKRRGQMIRKKVEKSNHKNSIFKKEAQHAKKIREEGGRKK